MNKNLEKEYKELISADVPDLWAKIEMGLEPKQSNAKKMRRLKNMRIWGAAAAAFFCMVITVPIIFGGRRGSSGNSSMTGENMSPAENHENADYISAKENNNMSGTTTDNGMLEAKDALEADAIAPDHIMAKVAEIAVEEDRTVFTVEIEDIYSAETNHMNLTEGDTIDLYDESGLYELLSKDLKEGETYIFEIVVQTDDSGAEEYLIKDIW